MVEKKVNLDAISSRLEAEFKVLLLTADMDDVKGANQEIIDYVAWLTEKTMEAVIAGRPDLVKSFADSAKVKAVAKGLELSKKVKDGINTIAGSTIRILAGALQ